MMGLYGVVVFNAAMEAKVKRVLEYVSAIKEVGKAPADLFSNMLAISTVEFLKLISPAIAVGP